MDWHRRMGGALHTRTNLLGCRGTLSELVTYLYISRNIDYRAGRCANVNVFHTFGRISRRGKRYKRYVQIQICVCIYICIYIYQALIAQKCLLYHGHTCRTAFPTGAREICLACYLNSRGLNVRQRREARRGAARRNPRQVD